MSIWWLALLLTNAMYDCKSMATLVVAIKMLCHHSQWQQQSYAQQAAYYPQQQYPAAPTSGASAPPPLPAEPAPPAPAAEAPPPPPLPPPGDPATSQVALLVVQDSAEEDDVMEVDSPVGGRAWTNWVLVLQAAAASAPTSAPAYSEYAQYDPAAYAAYYQQYNAYYGAYGTAPPQAPPAYPGYHAAQQAYPGYAQPTGYAAAQPLGYAAAPPAAPAAAPPQLPAPRPLQHQQVAVSSNAAPWQKAAAKVATAMQAQKQDTAAQRPAKPGVAKSFSLQPQVSKLRMGGGAAFAAASSPAYVKVRLQILGVFAAGTCPCCCSRWCSLRDMLLSRLWQAAAGPRLQAPSQSRP
jgi:hypothetical protein